MINFSCKSFPELDKYSKPIVLILADMFHRDKISSYALIRIIQWPKEKQDTTEVSLWGKKDRVISLGRDLPEDISDWDDHKKYSIVLDIICEALTALAEKEQRLSAEWVSNAKAEVLQMNFNFWVWYYRFENKKNKGIVATVFIHSIKNIYEIYLQITRNGVPEKMILFYKSFASPIVLDALFKVGKWRTADLLVITGKESEIEVQYTVSDQSLKFVNISPLAPASPYFNMFMLKPEDEEGWSKADQDKALDNYLNSAYPGLADIFRNATKKEPDQDVEQDTTSL